MCVVIKKLTSTLEGIALDGLGYTEINIIIDEIGVEVELVETLVVGRVSANWNKLTKKIAYDDNTYTLKQYKNKIVFSVSTDLGITLLEVTCLKGDK